MSIFDELSNIYTDTDNRYAVKELEARAKGHNRIEQSFQRKRYLNDHAFFLFLFTRIEDRIKKLSKKVTSRKASTLSNRLNKAPWELIKRRMDKDRLNLMEMAVFLTPFDGPDYHLIKRYKDQRDDIAHGGTVPRIDVNAAIRDFKRLYHDLKP